MTWISGRTLSPASGELVFWIDENAGLPAPQVWEQIWQVCSGIEPLVKIVPIKFSDRAFAASSGDDADVVRLTPVRHFSITVASEAEYEPLAPTDYDARSDCNTWRRSLTYALTDFNIPNVGGDAIAETKGCVQANCDTIAIALHIRGRNPSKAALSAALANDIARAICWRESSWRQFLPSGRPLSHQNANGTTDWGLMQINEATYEQQWNWKSNVARGLAILDEKRGYATTYLNKHQPYTSEMLENEMIQRYNSGTYYTWDANAQSWMVDPPNDYVEAIRKIMNQPPW